MCSLPQVQSPSITTYPPYTLFYLAPPPFPLVITILLPVSLSLLCHFLPPTCSTELAHFNQNIYLSFIITTFIILWINTKKLCIYFFNYLIDCLGYYHLSQRLQILHHLRQRTHLQIHSIFIQHTEC